MHGPLTVKLIEVYDIGFVYSADMSVNNVLLVSLICVKVTYNFYVYLKEFYIASYMALTV